MLIHRIVSAWWMPPLFLTIGLLPCLLPSITGNQHRLAFRDVSFFYTPLYEHVARFDDLGSGPAWNSLDGTGMPLAGETTTAVFYPVRWFVYRVVGDPNVAMSVYVWLHLILASIGARCLAIRQSSRRGKRDRWAAAVAAWVYPLSGAVIFLVTNPPFLVSAAWLPWAMLSLPNRKHHHDGQSDRSSGTAGFAMLSLAMMVLGGDPQTGLHAMLIITAWTIYDALDRRLATTIQVRLVSALRRLFMIGAVAGGVAAPQIAASLDWSSQSDRVGGITASQRYTYSVPPWRLAEWVTANASGDYFPIYQRITATIPGDGAMWTPSVYAGLLGVPALCAACFRRRRSRWGAVTILSVTASMGHFGLVWWIQTMTDGLPNVASQYGGVYDLLCRSIPGYSTFRYPTKWLPLVSLGVAMLASNLMAIQSSGLWRKIWWASGAVLVVAIAWNECVVRHAMSTPMIADEFWGPLRVAQGAFAIRLSYLVTLVQWLLVLLGIGLWDRGWIRKHAFRSAVMVLLIVDLSWFAWDVLPTVSVAQVDRLAIAVGAETPAEESLPSECSPAAWMRYSDSRAWPPRWRQESDVGRQVQVEASLRASRFGRWHLADEIPVLNSMVTIGSLASREYWIDAKTASDQLDEHRRPDHWKSMRTTLGSAGAMDEQGRWIDDPDGSLCGAVFHDESNDWLQYDRDSMDVDVVAMDGHLATYQVTVHRPGRLVRPVYQDGHWSSSYPVVSDGLRQYVELSTGTHTLAFEYAPWWYWPSLLLSFATTIGLAIAWCRSGSSWGPRHKLDRQRIHSPEKSGSASV